ncbi:probable phosphoglycerate mutase [Granulicatella balaenopterae]|uniref:Probable phosphoglycerate mutase n=1 Tax=Granulicatella balaenopterae TaxID=137733 RepID=A0A1H9HNV5_9LACT|nr:histidine phosphatase family protein [Granulicatella balaenopterae]SEQ63995.1 probable phosphoglycerate mutase [Granulicatella balaenopterae]
MKNKGVTLYFMRHGETYYNRFGKMQGWSDMPLTKEGRLDAIRSGLGSKDIAFDAVYTSDLRRTVETAQLFLRDNEQSRDLTVNMMPEFREVFFGGLEGLNVEDIWPELYKNIQDEITSVNGRDIQAELNGLKEMDPEHLAENFMEFWLRVEKGLLKVINRHRETDQNILIVSHGMTIRNILHELVPEFELSEPILNASLSIVEYRDGHYHLQTLNQTHHFALRKEAEERDFDLLPMQIFE